MDYTGYARKLVMMPYSVFFTSKSHISFKLPNQADE